jgi:hypothetical protein
MPRALYLQIRHVSSSHEVEFTWIKQGQPEPNPITISAQRLGLPLNLADASGLEKFPSMSSAQLLPDGIAATLQSRLTSDVWSVWFDIVPPHSALELVGWNRSLAEVFRRPVLRVPQFTLLPVSFTERGPFSPLGLLVFFNAVPGKGRTFWDIDWLNDFPMSRNISHLVVTNLRKGQAPFRDGVSEVVSSYQGGVESRGHSPFNHPWLSWASRQIDTLWSDVAIFMCDAELRDGESLLRLTMQPEPKTPVQEYVRPEEFAFFLSQLGSSTIVFQALSESSLAALRVFTADLSAHWPGVIILRIPGQPYPLAQFLHYYQYEPQYALDDRGAFLGIDSFHNYDPAVHPWEKRPFQELQFLERWTLAGPTFFDRMYRPPRWLVATQRTLEPWADALWRIGSRIEAESGEKTAVSQTDSERADASQLRESIQTSLRFVVNTVNRHLERGELFGGSDPSPVRS